MTIGRFKPKRKLLGTLLLLTAVGLFAQAGAGSPVGEVEYLEGDVRINGALVDFGYRVQLGDWVQTGPDSSVDIVFDRANIFRLGENTVAQLQLGTTRQSVDLKHGTFAAVFDRVRTLSGRGTFNVRTQTVAGGVRGTTFFFKVIDAQTTYMCTCNGTLELTPEGSDESFLNAAAHHSAYYFRGDGGAVTYEPADMLFHGDDTMDLIADEVGLTIPWGTLEK